MSFIFLSVRPKPRTIPMTLINKSMKTRLQTIDKRVVYIKFFVVTQKQLNVTMVTDSKGAYIQQFCPL